LIANGVTINSSASFNLNGQTQDSLTPGLVMTVIRNTALTPIAGTFSNLLDGAIVNLNGNNLQASHEGGDGNGANEAARSESAAEAPRHRQLFYRP
jgi:hypothetical protein